MWESGSRRWLRGFGAGASGCSRGNRSGIPPKVQRTDEQVAKIVAAQQEAAAAQAKAEQAEKERDQAQIPEASPEEKLKKELDDSRFSGM